MRLSKEKLKKIIKEEIHTIAESGWDDADYSEHQFDGESAGTNLKPVSWKDPQTGIAKKIALDGDTVVLNADATDPYESQADFFEIPLKILKQFLGN